MTSILGFIKYIADPQTQLAAITYWQLGSFAYVDSRSILSVLPLSIAVHIGPGALAVAVAKRFEF